ncbi:MAG: GNAT family N-acetyltransferase [Clostridiales bacterium]|nr:GNAT family N-acetyltransferase [Clostridiales bacterium]
MYRLETERLIIRRWKLSDSADHFEYAESELVGPNAGWKPLTSEEQSKSFIKWFMTCDYVYAIELKENNKVIGGIGINEKFPNPSIVDMKQRQIDYDLNPQYWGRGLVPEAVNRLIKFGFEEMNLDIIWCNHYEENYNSRRVNEKCGFKYQFTKEEVLDQFDNKKVNTLYYRIDRMTYDKPITS